jgi:uncharacterized protein
MKIGIISDTHGDRPKMKRVLVRLKDTDCLLHAGDLYRDVLWMQGLYHGSVTGVTGNSDPADSGPSLQLIEADNLKIMLCHGHIYHVQRSLTHLYYRGLEKQANVVVFGHTHIPLILNEGLLMINPGSLGRPRTSHGPTYAVLETGQELKVSIHSLDTDRLIMNWSDTMG